MNKNSNGYTFGFSAVLVIIVGLLLASAAIVLKPLQMENIKIEKMQDILASVGVEAKPDNANELFNKYITEQLVLTAEGEVVEGTNYTAFDIDLSKELRKPHNERLYPLFRAEVNDSNFIIVPMRGKGLWGPLWGYIALDAQMNVNNVYGAKFDHKSETPGLGAEINTTTFQQQYVGKKIFDENGNYNAIKAVKGGIPAGDMHKVDAISGGTITSNGVNEMVERTLEIYIPYFKAFEAQRVKTVPAGEVDEPDLISPEDTGGISPEEDAESETVVPNEN